MNKKSILINCSTLKVGGGIQVAHSFINQIKCTTTNQFVVVYSEELGKQLDTSDFGNHFTFIQYDMKPSFLNSIFGTDKHLTSLVRKYNVDKVFTVFGPPYWKPPVPHVCGFAKPQYIYKNSPFFKKLSIKDLLKLKLKEKIHMHSFKKHCDVLITENKDVTTKLCKLIEKPILTVTNNYNQLFDKEIVETSHLNALNEYKGCKLLTISANYQHKNLDIIPKVIDYLTGTYPKFDFKFFLTLEKELTNFPEKYDEYIEFMGRVDIKDCPAIYSLSDFMFLPTLLECFTASYCEAMKMEKPILTSRLDFAIGICEDAAEYFNPMSASSIGEAIKGLVDNPKRQTELKKNGVVRLQAFDNFKERANKYLEIIQDETNYTRS